MTHQEIIWTCKNQITKCEREIDNALQHIEEKPEQSTAEIIAATYRIGNLTKSINHHIKAITWEHSEQH